MNAVQVRKALQYGALAAGVVLVGAIGFTKPAHAYPDKAIELIISFPPAGATDALARAVAQGLTEELGQNIVVQNRPGAGGAIGLVAAARARPDGYQLYLAATTNQAIAAATYANQEASLLDDFEPIGQVGYAPHALVVPASSPVKSVAELVATSKKSPANSTSHRKAPVRYRIWNLSSSWRAMISIWFTCPTREAPTPCQTS